MGSVATNNYMYLPHLVFIKLPANFSPISDKRSYEMQLSLMSGDIHILLYNLQTENHVSGIASWFPLSNATKAGQ